MQRRAVLASACALAMGASLPLRARGADPGEGLQALKAVAVAHRGETVAVRGYGGFDPARPSNIKSASKSVVAALVGAAVLHGAVEGADQRVAPILGDLLPPDPDPRLQKITLGHLMSMRAGLESTSGPRYGAWVSQRDWVRAALARPFVDEPGGRMIYSTGTTHVLLAAVSRAAGRDALALARDWLGPVEGFRIADWERDPQGRYLGGNQMAMSVGSLLAFGEMCRRGGVAEDGARVLPEGWIEASWEPQARSRWSGAGYGWGWFLARAAVPGAGAETAPEAGPGTGPGTGPATGPGTDPEAGTAPEARAEAEADAPRRARTRRLLGALARHDVRYGWGYGGQMIYVVPALELSVAIVSDENRPSARTGYRDRLHRLMLDVMADVEAGREVRLPAA